MQYIIRLVFLYAYAITFGPALKHFIAPHTRIKNRIGVNGVDTNVVLAKLKGGDTSQLCKPGFCC